MKQVLIHRIFLEKTDLANLKSDAHESAFTKLKNVLSKLSNLKGRVD